jgi:hypothetical protein
MMPPRQYGRKKPKPGRGATAIFGAPTPSPSRDPLADITAGVGNLALSPCKLNLALLNHSFQS